MRAFFDIDTQLDFVTPGGALYGHGAERLIPAVARLNRYASERRIPLISTTDAHPENAAEFHVWPPHCVSGTFGQRKPCATLLSDRFVVPYDPAFSFAAPNDAVGQFIIEKNDLDMFSNPCVPDVLAALGVTVCVVYGVFIDYCVKYAIMGLLRTGRQVSLVTDASASISQEAGDAVIAEFIAAGGSLIASDDL